MADLLDQKVSNLIRKEKISYLDMVNELGTPKSTENRNEYLYKSKKWEYIFAPTAEDNVTDTSNHLAPLLVLKSKKRTEAGWISLIGITFIVAVLAYGLFFVKKPSSPSTDYMRCKVCDRKFTDFDNITSIKKTNMCENCYGNYKWGMEVTGKN